MSNIRLSSRYAKSLISLAAERGETDVLLKDMLHISNSIRATRDLQVMLASPVISGDKKLKVLFSVFAELNKTTHMFIELIVSKGREGDLGEIAQAFVQQVKSGRNIFDVELISAVPADDALRAEVSKVAKSICGGGEVEITEKVDSDLIGGFILRVNGMEYNASVSGKLKKVKKDFSKNPFVPAL
jgi:F-type H+-transporting ATPase subunit delta